MVPANELSYQKRIFEHPTRRQIFANTVGRICELNLTLRHNRKINKETDNLPYSVTKSIQCWTPKPNLNKVTLLCVFLLVESTLADEKWQKCWFSIPNSFTDLKEGFTRRKYIKNHLNGRLERKYCILWDFQIPNSKKGDQSRENGKTGKIRVPLE